MKFNFKDFSIKKKLVITITFALIISMTVVTIYSTLTLQNALIENSKKETVAVAEKYSGIVKAKIEDALVAARISANTLSTVYEEEDNIQLSRKDVISIGSQLLKKNKEFLGIGFLYHENGFDGEDANNMDSIGSNSEGLFAPYVFLDEENQAAIDIVNMNEIPTPKPTEEILDPYPYTVGGNTIFLMTAVAPILYNSIHKGNVAIDINLMDLQNIIADSKSLSKDSRIAIVSNGGIYAARNTKPKLIAKSIGENLSQNFPEIEQQFENIKAGKLIINIHNNRLFVRAPISIGKTNSPWQIRISVPLATITASAKSSLLIQILISITSVLFVIIILILLVKSILKPLDSFILSIEKISEGALNTEIEVKRKDEIGLIGKSVKTMTENIGKVIGQINKTSNDLIKGGIKINDSAKNVASGATEQASSVEEISTSIEEMLASINQNSENAKETERKANQSANQIVILNKAFEKTVDVLTNVTEKIEIINSIASRTDLLAINAAIEAARAGEQGKGFAVVAREVRKLAEKSLTASKEINVLSSESTKTIVNSVRLLNAVIPTIKETASLIKEISFASEEQNLGIEQINNTLTQLTQITIQNADAAETLASNADMYETHSKELKKVVSHFKTE